MIARSRPRATYQDVLAAPRHVVAEVLFGVLHTHPRPAAKHTRASSRLGQRLGPPFDDGRGGPGGWIRLDEPELHFGRKGEEDVVGPDLAGWRRARMPEVPDVAFFTLAPDWVCERVAHVWLVDPIARTLEAFELEAPKKPKRTRGAPSWRLLGVWRDEAIVRAPPFEAIDLELAALWT